MQKGLLSISKTSETHKDDYISIRIISDDGQRAIKVKVSVTNFAEALFGMIHQPCDFELNRKTRNGPK